MDVGSVFGRTAREKAKDEQRERPGGQEGDDVETQPQVLGDAGKGADHARFSSTLSMWTSHLGGWPGSNLGVATGLAGQPLTGQ